VVYLTSMPKFGGGRRPVNNHAFDALALVSSAALSLARCVILLAQQLSRAPASSRGFALNSSLPSPVDFTGFITSQPLFRFNTSYI